MAGKLLCPGGLLIVDPAMGDNGKLYPAFNEKFAAEMTKLVKIADYVLPNVTEACYLTGTRYRDSYDAGYISGLADKLLDMGARSVVLTGVSYDSDTTGVYVKDKKGESYYRHEKIGKGCHGTGDIYSSAFTGAIARGLSAVAAAAVAADFVVRCIKTTINDKEHWYGARFEPVLKYLIDDIDKKSAATK